MCILEEIGFTREQYMKLQHRGMRDYEIAIKELDVSLETLLRWKVKNDLKHEQKQPAYYFTVEEWKQKRDQGMLERDIAKEFGFTNHTDYYDYKDIIGIPKQRWSIERTPELLAQIKEYAEQSLTLKEIAERLDVKMTSATVSNIMREYGIKKKPKKPRKMRFTVEEWEEKRKQGKTEREIAKEFGFNSYSYYWRYRKELDIPKIRQNIERTPELIGEIKSYVDKGMSTRQIQNKVSVKMTQRTACEIIREEGLR